MMRQHDLFLLACCSGLLAFAVPAWALDKYVTPVGAGTYSGADWANAYSNIQQAVDACVGVASTIYLKSGSYSNTAQVVISNAVDLTLQGGYVGNTVGGLPGETTNAATLVSRQTNVNMRIIYGTNSSITLNNVTVSNGFLNASGLGLFLANCTTLITNSLIANNTYSGTIGQMGGGIYVSRGKLTLVNSAVRANGFSATGATVNRRGGGLYANSAEVVLSGVTVEGNYVNIGVTGGQAGGGVCVESGTSTFFNCTFATNTSASAAGYVLNGGALYANNVANLTLSNCVFVGNYPVTTVIDGIALYLSGISNGVIADCTFRDNFNPPAPVSYSSDISLAGVNQISIRNTVIQNGSVRGIYQAGTGMLSLTNCLIRNVPGTAIEAVTGTVSMANCTIANNGGWGFSNLNATVTIRNSIFWGNIAGGVTGPVAKLTINNTCSQEGRAGTGNLTSDPLFVAGVFLSTIGLPAQANTSPCIDAGSDQASVFGLDTRTTRTDGSNDLGIVDLGFHAVSGVAVMSNLVLYVDVNAGNNGNDGWSAASAKKNISAALTNALDGTTINIAAGNYTTNAGELFPLTILNFDLTLRGTNRNTTLVNAGGTKRVLSASGAGNLRLEGLTITNGYATSGAGLYLLNCRTLVADCTLVKNGSPARSDGCGIYMSAGSLTVSASSFVRNGPTTTPGWTAGYGGAIYAANNPTIVLIDTLFDGNGITGYDYTSGGCLYISGGNLQILNCLFVGNYLAAYYSSGVLDLRGLASLAISNCVFSNNYAGVSLGGGLIYLAGAGAPNMQVIDCKMISHRGSSVIVESFSSGGQISFQRCVLARNAGDGLLKTGSASLSITNCLIYAQTNHGVRVTAGTVSIGNCTIATNAWGVTNSAGTVAVKNSIIWGNTNGGLSGVTATYTDCQSPGIAGTGNISLDPLFVDTTYYHEKSKLGNAVGGYFSGGSWERSSSSSPCIDAGDPADSWANEPEPNSKRRNMGAYGNTSVASASVAAKGSVCIVY